MMNLIKLITIMSISFLIATYALQPQLYRVGLEYNLSGFSEISTNNEASHFKIDYRTIFEMAIPKPEDSDEAWLNFISQIKLTAKVDEQRPLFRFHNRSYPLLAYLAKHKPKLFMNEIEGGNIDMSVFSLMLQMGLLQDWHMHAKDIGQIIRVEPKALIALAVSRGSDYAEDMARMAFIERDITGGKDLYKSSPRSMAYAFNSMTGKDIESILISNISVNLDNELTSNPVLGLYMKNIDYKDFIKRHASTKIYNQGYLVDLFLAGDQKAGDLIVNDYIALVTQDEYKGLDFCSVCALALGLNSGIGLEVQKKQLGVR